MDSSEILKQVRKIEIKTRGLSNDIFAGHYHSAFKGRGMSFSEVREYRPGDDVRDIDWNVTARSRTPYVKIYEEERELTMMLLIDVSGSRIFGTGQKTKKDIIAEVAATLAFSATDNNDKVGCIMFSDRIERFIPPKKGRSHILMIIRELLEFSPQNSGTNISEPIRYLTNAIKKRCTAFVLSDFIEPDRHLDELHDALQIAAGRHDIIALQIYDRMDRELPDVGILEVEDSESGRKTWIDTSSESLRIHYRQLWNERSLKLASIFNRSRVDNIAFSTDDDYVKALIKLFKSR